MMASLITSHAVAGGHARRGRDIVMAIVMAVAVVAIALGGLLMGFAIPAAQARPAYAQRTGLPCAQCHVNPQGGGKRNAFGRAFARNGHRLPGEDARTAKRAAGRSKYQGTKSRGTKSRGAKSSGTKPSGANSRDDDAGDYGYGMWPGMMGGPGPMGPGMMWDSGR